MKNILFLLFIILIFSCKQDTSRTKEVKKEEIRDIYDLPEWAKDATIYEVNLRQYTEEGTFDSFVSHLPRLKAMGVDILWFMPIYPISKTKRKGSLGSYYAVSDYKGVNPEHGTPEDFKTMVKAIHDQDMHIILDFVPNHTGWDNPWIKEHPEWYTQDRDGNVIDPIDPGTGESWGWTDVADLNYDNQEMRKEMISSFKFWVEEMDIDGFRQDVAHNVPQDFWDSASAELLKIKPLFLLAESEVESHRNSKAFHTTYGWSFHHILNDIAKGEKNASDIVTWYKQDSAKFTNGFHMHFTSNHDENTWAGTVFDRMGAAHKALAVITATLQGMPLIYGGQEEPLRKRLKFFEKDNIGFEKYEYSEFYKRLFTLKHSNKALFNGKYGDESPEFFANNDEVLYFKREKAGDELTVIVNLSKEPQNLKLQEDLTGKELYDNTDLALKKGIVMSLQPYEYRVVTSFASN
jgi:glycosidase